MPYFVCTLASEDGRVFSETFLSVSGEDCRRHFEAEGYGVLSVKRDWRRFSLPGRRGDLKIKDRDFIMFNQELIALIRAGYPVLRSIEVIAGRSRSAPLRGVLKRAEAEIRQGKALSEALAPFERRFSKIYTASVMAGEQSGNLPETLGQYVQYAKIIARTRARVRSALTYPTLLFIVSIGLVFVLLNVVLPNFAEFYRDFEAKLPFITVALVNTAMVLRQNFLLFALLTAGAVLGYARLRRSEASLLKIEKAKLRIPIGGGVWLETAVSLFSRTLGLLLGAGVSLVPAVSLAARAIPNRYLSAKASEVPVGISNGESLTDSLTKTGAFPPLALDMVRIGETSANLPGMLKEVSEVFDERIQSRIDAFVSLIEPVIIIFMGLLVAGMLLAVYFPIFNIIQVTR